MKRPLSTYRATVLAATLLSLTSTALSQEGSAQEAATQAATAEDDREQLAAEVEELKAMLREAREALDDARAQAEHQRKLAEEARSMAAKQEHSSDDEDSHDEKPTITERIERAGLEHAARKASEFVSKQRQRLMPGGEEEEASNKKSKRHHRDHGGERIVSVRLNLDILVVKRSGAKEAHPTGRDEPRSDDHGED